MKCVIIDDEPLSIKVLSKHVKHTHGLELVKSFVNAFEGLYYIQTQSVDLVFLDIQMPGVNGLQFIKILKYPPKIIITTAYKEYALEALELGVIDYLLKPIAYERFLGAVSKSIEQNVLSINPVVQDKEETNRFFFIKDGSHYVRIYENDLLFIHGDRNYSILQLSEQKFTISGNLAHYLPKLSPGKFYRVHKSYIVALDKIEKYSARSLWICDTTIPIGRTYKQSLMRYLEKRRF